MNAPSEGHLSPTAVELLPLTAVAPSETHIQQLRRKRYNLEALADLRSSIAKLGIQQPIVVRRLAAMRGLATYEIVAGERRYKAAGHAGLAHVPAIVRELSDSEVLEIQLVENLQREDLHPLEEAAGYDELLKVSGIPKEELGDRVGKSRSWIYSRLNLLKLPAAVQEALQTGQLDVSRALVVASVAEPERQQRVLELAVERNHSNNPVRSVRQLRAIVVKDRLTFPLVGAPFPTNDAGLLPEAGDCSSCQFRTGNCDPEAADPDVCTNVPCYERKVKLHGDRRRADVLARGGKVLRGEEARAISPSVKTVYGHVDLDLVCEHDDFPEKEPEDVDYDNASDPRMVAWRAREEAWQPRTYRALLADETYESILIDDPKTKQLRELLPFKVAQQLLKKKGIDLPSYANKKRPERVQRESAKQESKESAEARIKREEAEKLDARIREATLTQVLTQVKAKHSGTVGAEELIFLADSALQDLPEEVDVWKMFGQKDPGWQFEKTLEKMSAKDLPKLITVGIVANGLADGYSNSEKAANAILARMKIDAKAIEKQVRAELAPAKKPTPTATKGKKK